MIITTEITTDQTGTYYVITLTRLGKKSRTFEVRTATEVQEITDRFSNWSNQA